jgi:hypothetical protein|uniref:hypothetical protein n=1 Tax=Cephaloticoccus sp. TaxID=1985742 RepID=UPI004049B515
MKLTLSYLTFSVFTVSTLAHTDGSLHVHAENTAAPLPVVLAVIGIIGTVLVSYRILRKRPQTL